MPRLFTLLLLSGLLASPNSRAAADDAPTFASLLEQTTLAQIDAVQTYVAEHADAPDAEEAITWLLSTARTDDREERVAPTAEAYLARDASEQDAALAQLARAVRSVARARTGNPEGALEDFRAVIEEIPVRAGASAISFAVDLANAFQLAGQVELARGVYEEMEKAFFLNAEVQRYVGTRAAKLALVGDAPPEAELEDLAGEPVDLASYEGKVVLLDFWATNCAPCIEMLPRLKRLHAELGPAGFEIVGFSLDDDADLVREFARRQEMPWRQVLATDDGAKAIFTFHAESIPTLYVMGRDGKIVAADLRGETLERLVRKLVAERAGDD